MGLYSLAYHSFQWPLPHSDQYPLEHAVQIKDQPLNLHKFTNYLKLGKGKLLSQIYMIPMAIKFPLNLQGNVHEEMNIRFC